MRRGATVPEDPHTDPDQDHDQHRPDAEHGPRDPGPPTRAARTRWRTPPPGLGRGLPVALFGRRARRHLVPVRPGVLRRQRGRGGRRRDYPVEGAGERFSISINIGDQHREVEVRTVNARALDTVIPEEEDD